VYLRHTFAFEAFSTEWEVQFSRRTTFNIMGEGKVNNVIFPSVNSTFYYEFTGEFYKADSFTSAYLQAGKLLILLVYSLKNIH
jgi:hypothetical protein